MKKKLAWFMAVLTLIVIGMQAIRPDRLNPPTVDSLAIAHHLRIDPDIAQLLRTACFDCHSNETRWPWYSEIAPASWLLARDVSEGRKRLNFSLWGKYAGVRQLTALSGIAEEVSEETMPYPPYLLLHPEARLDSVARQRIVAWAERESDRIAGDN